MQIHTHTNTLTQTHLEFSAYNINCNFSVRKKCWGDVDTYGYKQKYKDDFGLW